MEHPDRRGIENQDVKLLLEARDQLIHARVLENTAGMGGGATGAEQEMLARLTECVNAELAIGHQIHCNRAIAAQPLH